MDQAQRDRAVRTFDRDVLVAASAGTGKTTVLTERVVHALTHQRSDITRILVLTFTEAAAEEMRSRIAHRLHQACSACGNAHLRRQWLYMDAAPISTIHAFCKRTLDTLFFHTGLDPNSRILDDDQKRILLNEALDRVLEHMWADSDLEPGLRSLLHGRNLGPGRGGFLESLKEVHTFLEGVPFPKTWLQRARDQVGCDYDNPHLSRHRARWVDRHVTEIRDYMRLSRRLDRVWCEGQYLTEFIQQEILPPLDQWQETLAGGDVETCIRQVRSFAWPRLPGRRLPYDQATRNRVKNAYDKGRDCFIALKHSALFEKAYHETLGTHEGQQGLALLDLVDRLGDTYDMLKRERQYLDYADLEHKLLDLLGDSPEVAEELRQRYDLVFLDEYQDVNAVQQAILDYVRRPGGFFAVGDIKQSIYGFRQARPEIFLHALHQAQEGPQGDQALRVDLITNFRCRTEIIDFTNTVFARLMQSETGGLMYDRHACLVPGPLYKEGQDTAAPVPVELAILDESPDNDDESSMQHTEDLQGVTAVQRQAAWIARRIQRMVGYEEGDPEFCIYDKSESRCRPVRYGDIVILMRSVAGRANDYAEVLRLAGVPVSSQASSGYFACTEVLDILSLLRVLDNPRQDIALGATLRSALFSVSDEQLAEIRLFGPDTDTTDDLYACVTHYARQGPDKGLREHLHRILQDLDTWRTRRVSLADLLWQVYRTTNYLSFVSGLPNGAQRRANLLKLHDRAVRFEQGTHVTGEVSLERFVAFMEQLLEQQQDWAPAEPDSACTNAVRIMSIHRSKGLEFPVVFLAGLERGFNLDAGRGPCLTHDTLGLGITVVDPELRAAIKGPFHELIAHEHKRRDLTEELRILYVAVTRARERLVLCTSVEMERVRQTVELGAALDNAPIPEAVLARAGSLMNWLLLALSGRPSLQQALGGVLNDSVPEDPTLQITVLGLNELQGITRDILDRQRTLLAYRQELGERGSLDQAQAETVIRALKWQYPFAAATHLSAKQSVSDITHRDDEFAPFKPVHRSLPAFGIDRQTTKRIDPREAGTAMHRIIEALDLECPPALQAVQSKARDLAKAGLIHASVLKHINHRAIVDFFTGDIGRHCFERHTQVIREWAFTMRMPASEIQDAAYDIQDFIVVQGIVDMVVMGSGETYVIDFKTDHIQEQELASRTDVYRRQLDLYQRAVQIILKPTGPVSKWLYFLSLGKGMQM
jgi:ATP-dependent helicase/nuclease subunit A